MRRCLIALSASTSVPVNAVPAFYGIVDHRELEGHRVAYAIQRRSRIYR